jgi:hypothetical protein
MTMIYQLTYELITPDKDYTPLYQLLEKGIGHSSIHVLRDTWWFNSNEKTNDLCDKIKSKLGDGDTFVLTELSSENTNGWLSSKSWEWRRAQH